LFKNSQLSLVYIGGMIPSETALAIIDKQEEVLFKGKCDDKGEFNYRISRKYIGEILRFSIRQSGFKFDHEIEMKVQR